jgi:pyruvate formate lyase activating enzyme
MTNSKILQNLRTLSGRHSNVWLRVPVVPGVSDASENAEALAGFAASLPGVRRVCLLPYHAAGVGKGERLGGSSEPRLWSAPARSYLEGLAAIFARAGIETQIGG